MTAFAQIYENPVAEPHGQRQPAIELQNVFKRYAIFSKPEDRLKQMVVPRLQRLVRATPGKYFREFSAVNDVSLTVGKGETIGIIGRNGSGKSTLLQLIVGTLTPTSGTVSVHGRIAALLELGAGFNPEFTGRENVYVNGAILGFSREEMDEKFESITAFANIGEFIERPVKTYSSGMFVRLAFAVATAVEPDILVVDEALAVGDEAFQRKCFARIEAIKERGGTILFVSHGAQTIVQLCDRAVLMEAGQNILEGEPKLVVGQYQRLVNASDGGAAKIKAEILAMGGFARVAPVLEVLQPVAIAANADVIDEEENDGLADYFDPNLKSETTIFLEERGAIINDVHITTLRGKRVNVLRSHKQYRINYRVFFNTECDNVAFGFSISNSAGLNFGGAGTSLDKGLQIPAVETNQEIAVSFDFVCVFNAGTYFLSAGTSGCTNEDRYFLNKILDAIVFCVNSTEYKISTGTINLKPNAIFIVNTPEISKFS
jgi:lipopolysaccharide transport system ATP-binding protein